MKRLYYYKCSWHIKHAKSHLLWLFLFKEKGFIKMTKNLKISSDKILLIIPNKYIDLSLINDDMYLNFPYSDEDIFVVKGYVYNIVQHWGQFKAGRKGPPRINFILVDAYNNQIQCTLFGVHEELKPLLNEGNSLILQVKKNIFNGNITLNVTSLYPPEHHGKILPIYPSVRGVISSDKIESIIRDDFHNLLDGAVSLLKDRLLDGGILASESEIFRIANSSFGSIEEIIREIHTPTSLHSALRAKDEIQRISALEIIISGKKKVEDVKESEEYSINYEIDTLKKLSDHITFKLTDEQKRASFNILKDVKSNKPMKHLLSGDVGTGKTAVAGLVAASVYSQNHNVAILLPNSNLPEQFLRELSSWWPYFNYEIVTSNSKPVVIPDRPTIYIGSTSILTKLKDVPMGLVIVDEQHKFSVSQRESLSHKNLLEATATCIPRTQGLIQFGGYKTSVLKECHVKKYIDTKIKYPNDRFYVLNKIKDTIQRGKQVIIIYARSESKETIERKKKEADAKRKKPLKEKAPKRARVIKNERRILSVEEGYNILARNFPNDIVYLHSKVSDEHRQKTMAQLRSGEKSICVATTTVEVGVDLPNVEYVVINNPEMFGLSQLHQLRGRAARKGGTGYFDMYLNSNDNDEEVMKRLEVLVGTQDGFEVSERDMYLRGIGDLSSDKQKGKSQTLFQNLKITPDIFTQIRIDEI